jgi:Winged helix DNA-binding domain
MASVQVLSLRAVNRALLARQLLLKRQVLPVGEPDRAARVVQTIEHLVGLQAQAPFPPYYGLHSRLDGFRPEDLAALIDLPTAPRPGADAPAPVRLTAEFDNLVLSHAERSRVVSPESAGRLYTINGVIPGAVLVDGFVAGMWRLARTRDAATVTIEMFGPVRRRDAAQRDALTAEAERVLAFGAPGTAHQVSFAPLAGA